VAKPPTSRQYKSQPNSPVVQLGNGAKSSKTHKKGENTMKTFKNMITMAIILITLIGTMGAALAADKVLNTTVRDVTTAIDKNGAEYVRLIVADQRELNGIKYETDAALMAFGPQVQEAKSVKKGDQIKAIVSGREYQGRLSYTLIKLLK
jgi:hypothetical protein